MINYDFIALFILLHLLGDFVLQTDRIVRMKSSSAAGLAVHSGIVLALQAIILGLFGTKGILAGIVSGLLHFVIDYGKNLFNRYFSSRQLLLFIADQFLHMAVIFTLALLLEPAMRLPPGWSAYLVFLEIMIALTYVSTIAAKLLVRDVMPELAEKGFFEKHERLFDALIALAMFFILFLQPVWYLVLFPAVFIFFEIYDKVAYRYSYLISVLKFLVYTAAGLSAHLVFITLPIN